jgi:hypothetical protein
MMNAFSVSGFVGASKSCCYLMSACNQLLKAFSDNVGDGVMNPSYEGLQVLQTNFVYALASSVLRRALSVQNLHN